MATSKFYEEIKIADTERAVEHVFQKGLNIYFPNNDITYPFKCDGFIDSKTESGKLCKLIIEYKLDELLNSKVCRAKVLIQVVFYLKRFENAGEILPNVCLVGDKNECFVMQTNELLKYLDEDVDWSISPSTAHEKYPDLVLKIANNEEINPFIFNINEQFSFKDVAEKIKDLADNVVRYVRVTEHNIANIYDYFCKNVIKNTKKIKAHDLVGIFIGVISDKENYYQHPGKKNILVANGKNIDINGDGFISFFKYFDRTYTPQEKNKFSEIADRLIEDTERRNHGDFFTNTPWVDYAHKMISEAFGDDWKEKYVVIDAGCGTKNLTRDYKFKELYSLTLEQSELDISERYNPEGVAFQFDFLNDYIPMPDELIHGYTKIPDGMLNAFKENKPIIWFMNPPYATVANFEKSCESNKEIKIETFVQKQMQNFGKASANLYAQFLYRVELIKKAYNLTNCNISIFCPTLFLSGNGYKEFRKSFLKEFLFNNGIQFKASHFADCSDSWGISFSIWKSGETIDKNNFEYKCCDLLDGEVSVTESKVIYNVDGLKSGKEWIKEPIKGIKLYNTIPLKSGINIGTTNGTKLSKDAFGCYANGGNNIDSNTQNVFILTSGYNTVTLPTTDINKLNFDRVCANFSARRLIDKNWMNWQDEYLAPNEEHPSYNEFVNDSIIYSLFESKSNQSSLRQVEYKGKLWDIKNEFFWMSKQQIEELANEYNLDFTYNDAHTSNERYVYEKLQTITLSKEAQAVLDKAHELVVKSFKYREMFNEEHNEYQILNFDAGYYQLKQMWKEYMPDDFKQFKELYKKLSDKMRPMVKTLGFLK